MQTFPRNQLEVWIMRILVWALCAVLTLSVISITGCSTRIVRIPPPQLPPADPLCLIDVDENGELPDVDLPKPPQRDRCPESVAEGQTVDEFNQAQQACMEQKAKDHALADSRGNKMLDKERNYRQACVQYIRKIRK